MYTKVDMQTVTPEAGRASCSLARGLLGIGGVIPVGGGRPRSV